MKHTPRAVISAPRTWTLQRVAGVFGLSATLATPTQTLAMAPAARQPPQPGKTGGATQADAPAPLLTPTPKSTVLQDTTAEDRAPKPGIRLLPLDAVVKHARDNAMRVRVARTRLDLGDAAVAGAKPLLPDNPQLYIGAGARWNQLGTNFELQSTLTQPIEIGRERSLRIKAGRRYRDYLDKELAQTQWEVYANVHYAYNMALLARERAATADRTLAFSTRLLEVAERRAQAGEISSLRVRIATGELAQARQAKLNADLEYRIACIHLAEMAGWPVGELIGPSGSLTTPGRVRDAADLIAQVQQQHPALKAREAMVELGQARAVSADRDRLPEPQIGVYFGREWEPGATINASKIALFMLTLPLPFWKRNQAARAQTRAELSVAEQELAAVRYNLTLSAQRAVDALNTAAERVRTYSSDVVPRFQENLNLLQRAFELGEVDILEVFVARENFLRIQNEALDAYRAYFDAEYALETILGSPLQTIAG
jgi:outer membrane protein, heavy metal efflux system